MNENLCLIDTDILSYILKQREPIYQKSCDYLKIHKRFIISCITYYECVRGYKAVNAFKRLQVFHEFLKITDIVYLDNTILNKAGEIYGLLKNKGELIGELFTDNTFCMKTYSDVFIMSIFFSLIFSSEYAMIYYDLSGKVSRCDAAVPDVPEQNAFLSGSACCRNSERGMFQFL